MEKAKERLGFYPDPGKPGKIPKAIQHPVVFLQVGGGLFAYYIVQTVLSAGAASKRSMRKNFRHNKPVSRSIITEIIPLN